MKNLDANGAGVKQGQSGRKLPTHARMLQLEKAFLDHGYSELSMRGLAKACDLTTRALYYYFRDRKSVV